MRSDPFGATHPTAEKLDFLEKILKIFSNVFHLGQKTSFLTQMRWRVEARRES